MRISHNTLVILVASGLAAAGGALVAQDSSDSKMKTAKKSPDAHFVAEAASGGMAEVELGKLATQKASDQRVKQFGQKMVDDHSKANDELKEIAAKENIPIPSTMNAKDKATVDKLSALSGPAFDRAYMKDMVADHKKDVAAFQKEANTGKDEAIKGFASKTLPILQEHLKLAEDIQPKV
ncbi:MAG: outer membrane protein [Bryobacterales bacterium]|nr:outer membrane protein [Bryobacterales bacterium]